MKKLMLAVLSVFALNTFAAVNGHDEHKDKKEDKKDKKDDKKDDHHEHK